MVFVDISNSNTNISTIIDFTRSVDELAEIAFSGIQNTENENCGTLQKLVHKLIFSTLDMLINVICGCIRVLLLEQSEF